MTAHTDAPSEAVLVVEVDDGVALPLRCCLERAGHAVERVTTAAAALDRAEAGGLALVVIDTRLPDMKGDELAGRIAALRPELAVLVLSHGRLRGSGAESAGLSHLAMPFRLRELLVAVHGLIGHAPTRIPAARARYEQTTSAYRGATPETVVGQVPQNVV